MVDTNEMGMIYTPHTTQEVDDMKSPYFTYNSASAFHLFDQSCVLAFFVFLSFRSSTTTSFLTWAAKNNSILNNKSIHQLTTEQDTFLLSNKKKKQETYSIINPARNKTKKGINSQLSHENPREIFVSLPA